MPYLFIVGLALTVAFMLLLVMVHFGFRAPRIREKGNPGDLGLTYQTVSIPTVSGKRLFGWLLPVPGATCSLIILHGWGGNAELMLPMALPFHRAGINVLLVDSRNHGRSDRDSFSSLPRFAEDAERAVGWLKRVHPEYAGKVTLLGHSVGGGAVLFAASRRNDIDAVISVSAFVHPEWMMRRFLKRLHLPQAVITLVVCYVEWIIGHRYEEIAPVNTICRVKSPVLLVHGKADRTVPIEDALTIERACGQARIRLLEIDDADHDSVEKIEEHGEELVRFLRDFGFSPPLPGRQENG